MLTREQIAGVTKGRVVQWTQWLLFLNTFVAESVFRQRDFADKSIDLQVVLKMSIWAGTFIYCLYFVRLWMGTLTRIDKFTEILLLLVITVSCFVAPNTFVSLASAFSVVSVFLLLMMCSSLLTNKQILEALIWGGTLVGAISLVVYFAVPDFGRMKEWQGDVRVIGARLTGITGTANVAGYISAFCLLALYYYRKYLPKKIPLYYWGFVVVNFANLVLSNSRTAMAALFLSVVLGFLSRVTPSRLAALFAGLCLIIVLSVSLDHEALFSMLSRSGDATEITSGTGRAAIWAEVVKLIEMRPILGWGYASSVTVLGERSDIIGHSPTHAHNAFLQVALTTGFVGLFLFVTLIIIKLIFSCRLRDPLNVSFISFLLIDGITEPIAFLGPATTTTLASCYRSFPEV
jgi:exopolysaccharide production protein ExoQ